MIDCRAATAADKKDAANLDKAPRATRVGEPDLHEPVPADHHRRPRGHPGGGGQPVSAIQTQVQRRLRLRERSSVHLRPRSQERQEVDQFLIRIRNRGAGYGRAIGQAQPYPIAAIDQDVLHQIVLHQRLQAAQPEQGVEHCLGQALLQARRPSRLACHHQISRS